MKPILNVDDAETIEVESGEWFRARVRPLAKPLGARAIGANVTTVPPGKAAYPLHHHFGNEEHFFVLGGTGTLRWGSETYAVRAGDYVVTPPGGAERAHQFVNTGTEDLIYLSISTLALPEVVGYPDSKKTGVRVASSGDSSRFIVEDRLRDTQGYWDGEDGEAIRELTRSSDGEEDRKG